jgi:DNA gyrase subunit A
MKTSYLDYAMSVIVSRALPDVRDGLKPVHRRILHAMNEAGCDWNKPYRKSARVVGDVMGKYHPHGDSAIYDAMVRMAQDFSMRVPLIDGQGNFGSMDGDRAAAMRYTEARMAKAAHALLADIDKDTVNFQANYDNSAHEPVVMPAQFPNLLANGAGGIAVGMATNIPPHNLGEVIDATIALIDNPSIDIEALIELMPGPDFPTGGIILGRAGIYSAFRTGRGSVMIRSKTHFEKVGKDRDAIVATEIPYQVNKSRMIERIAEVVKEERVEGISELRDESDRDGVRVVIELKRDAMPEVVLNQLFRYTPLQTSFGVNMVALNAGRPELLNLKQIIAAFIEHREEVVTRRTAFELRKARERAHMLVGLAIAVANIDEVIKLIRAAKDPASARAGLMAQAWPAERVRALIELIDEPDRRISAEGEYRLSEIQARAILDLRLHRLTGLERDKIAGELGEIAEKIKEFLAILQSRERLLEVLRSELLAAREEFADERRTAIEDREFEHDIEDLIQREEMVVTVSHTGYVKRVPLSTYRAQARGGKGRSGMSTREEDFVARLLVANTHAPLLFFTSKGKVYKIKVYRLPMAAPQARGKPIVNLLPLDKTETITTVLAMPEDQESWGELQLMFATSSGRVRRNRGSDFANVLSSGIIAMKLDGDDSIIGVRICAPDADVMLAARGGKCIRFVADDVRLFKGRSSQGVCGIALAKDDRVISMSILKHIEFTPEERDGYFGRKREGQVPPLDPARRAEIAAGEQLLLTVRNDGLGKRSSSHDYRVTRRGGKGIINIALDKGSEVVAGFAVGDEDEIMLITNGGKVIRTPVDKISRVGRGARGVTILKLAKDEKVVSVARLDESVIGDGAEENGDDEVEGADEVPDDAGPASTEDADGSGEEPGDEGVA